MNTPTKDELRALFSAIRKWVEENNVSGETCVEAVQTVADELQAQLARAKAAAAARQSA